MGSKDGKVLVVTVAVWMKGFAWAWNRVDVGIDLAEVGGAVGVLMRSASK